MTIFGWFTVVLWTLMGALIRADGTKSDFWARILCLFMVVGTLAWGTGTGV